MTQQIRAKKSSRLNPKKQQKLEIQIDSSWKQITITLQIKFNERIFDPPKILKDFKVYLNSEGGLVIRHFVQQLKHEKIIKQQCSLSFYNQQRKIYVFGVTVPQKSQDLSPQTQINSKYIGKQNILKIKIRSKKKIAIDALIQQQRQKYDQILDDQKNNKGQKEKKICEVVEKVALWRKFYTGFYDEDGNYFQKPLESAAQQVGIAKKTLDDYLLQIRNGKKYGFNFNQKFNSKIGQLRAFVRDEKKKAEQK